MDHIVNVARQLEREAMNTPTPTEKSQIVIHFINAQTMILRFNSVKEGRAAFDKIKKAKAGEAVHIEKGMFEAVVAADAIGGMAFVDHDKRAKFIPIP